MKIKTIIFGALLTALPAMADNYLYWMVDVSEQSNDFLFDYATVSLDGTKLENQAGGESFGTDVYNNEYYFTEETGDMTDPVYAAFAATTGSKFLFELFVGNTKIAYKSVNYNDLKKYIKTSTMGTANAYTASGFTLVPEPTSGLLMLLGFAGLALRRKRG